MIGGGRFENISNFYRPREQKMSGGEMRKVSRQDIQLVQNLIERCLQLYMNQKEVVDTLLYQAKIEPGFTELVWQKLEEENQEFFKAYHVRLLLKNQILVFNELLKRQVELMQKVCSPGVASVPLSNGSSSSTLQQTPPCYLSDHASTSSRPSNMFCNGGSSNVVTNSATSANQSIQLANRDASIIGARTSATPSLLSTHNSQMERSNGVNGINGMTGTNGIDGASVKSEPSYSSSSDFTFGADHSFLDMHTPLGVEPNATFNGPLSEPLLDMESPSFGFLSQIPRNFSFSDLTDDFTQSADILENYGKSPFLGHEMNNFSGSPGRDCKEEDRRLDTISEGLSYDDFGSD